MSGILYCLWLLSPCHSVLTVREFPVFFLTIKGRPSTIPFKTVCPPTEDLSPPAALSSTECPTVAIVAGLRRQELILQ